MVVGGKWVVGGGANRGRVRVVSIPNRLSVSLDNPGALVWRECSKPQLLLFDFGLNALSQLLRWWRVAVLQKTMVFLVLSNLVS